MRQLAVLWAYLAFGIVLLASVAFLIVRDERRRCPSCKRWRLQATRGQIVCDGPGDDEWQEYRCRHCGKTWRRQRRKWTEVTKEDAPGNDTD